METMMGWQDYPPPTLDKWNRMSLSEQFETVFHPSACNQHKNSKASVDPSRSKPSDLPYFIRIVTRRKRKEAN